MPDNHDDLTKQKCAIITRAALYAIAYGLCDNWRAQLATVFVMCHEFIGNMHICVSSLSSSCSHSHHSPGKMEGSTTMDSHGHQHRAFDGHSTMTASTSTVNDDVKLLKKLETHGIVVLQYVNKEKEMYCTWESIDTDHGPRTTDHGPRTTDHGPRTTDHRRHFNLYYGIT
jgi:hypothetical protein